MPIALAIVLAATSVALAAISWCLRRADGAEHLRLWTTAWLFGAAHHLLVGTVGWWGVGLADAPMRLVFSAANQATALLQLGFTLAGVASMLRGGVSRLLLRCVAIAALAIASLVTLATIPASWTVGVAWRLGTYLSFETLLLPVAAIAVLRHRRAGPRLGGGILAAGFLVASSVAAWHLVVVLGSLYDREAFYAAEVPMRMAQVATQCLLGVGLTVWSLEQKHAELRSRDAALEERTRQLLEAQRMESVGRLAGGIAHDFNNALAVILGLVERLRLRRDLPGDTVADLAALEGAGQQAASITSQLLAMSRRGAASRVCDAGQTVTDTMQTLRRLVGDRVDLRTAVTGEQCGVRLQRGQLEQILLNLVVNARDACGAQGHIDVELAVRTPADPRATRLVELVVRDDGAGMSDEVARRAMEPFFTTKGEAGTGLGLAVVSSIVRHAGGTIALDSAPGRGTTVRITWPAAAGEPSRPEVVRERSQVRGTITVMLAEDDDAVRDLTAESLRAAGYRVLPVGSVEQALAQARRLDDPIDVLLTDVQLPRMSGVDLAAAVRRLRPQILVLFISGFVDPDSRSRMLPDAPLLHKPFTRRQLLGYVESHLAG